MMHALKQLVLKMLSSSLRYLMRSQISQRAYLKPLGHIKRRMFPGGLATWQRLLAFLGIKVPKYQFTADGVPHIVQGY